MALEAALSINRRMPGVDQTQASVSFPISKLLVVLAFIATAANLVGMGVVLATDVTRWDVIRIFALIVTAEVASLTMSYLIWRLLKMVMRTKANTTELMNEKKTLNADSGLHSQAAFEDGRGRSRQPSTTAPSPRVPAGTRTHPSTGGSWDETIVHLRTLLISMFVIPHVLVIASIFFAVQTLQTTRKFSEVYEERFYSGKYDPIVDLSLYVTPVANALLLLYGNVRGFWAGICCPCRRTDNMDNLDNSATPPRAK